VATATAKAQTLAGRVRVAETHVPLRGALLVLVADSSNAIADSTRVDSAGVFYLNALAPGRYRVEIHPPGVLKRAVLSTPPVLLSPDSLVEREYLIPVASLVPVASLIPIVLEEPVTAKGITLRPKYPPELQKEGIEGEVLPQFVVDSNGHVAMSSIRIVRATRPEFADAVRDVILRTRFNPARVGNRAAAQLVQQLFEFHIPGY
jgi:TonB family protein